MLPVDPEDLPDLCVGDLPVLPELEVHLLVLDVVYQLEVGEACRDLTPAEELGALPLDPLYEAIQVFDVGLELVLDHPERNFPLGLSETP